MKIPLALLIDEAEMRSSWPRAARRAMRECFGKCAGCAWPANTICTRDWCPQGVAYARGLYRETMAELEKTCHTPEDWAAVGEALLRKAADATKKL